MQQQQQQFIQQQQQQFVGMGTHLMQMHAHLFQEQCRAKDAEAVTVKRRHDEVLRGEVARAQAELAASKAEAAEALEKATTARDHYKSYVVQLEGAVRGSFVHPMLEEVLKGSLSVHMLFKYLADLSPGVYTEPFRMLVAATQQDRSALPAVIGRIRAFLLRRQQYCCVHSSRPIIDHDVLEGLLKEDPSGVVHWV